MREEWEYKKLGDFIFECSIKNKKDENIPVYSVTNSQGFCKEYFNKEVASQNKSTYKIVPYGAFAYNPSRINVGSIDWQKQEDRVIVSPLYIVFTVSENLDNNYLLYFIKSQNTMSLINGMATGTVRLNLKFSMLKEFLIPLPPISQQRLIVSELDEINSLIALKREQLKKYDELAQSLFYEMFGDPVENEKGWEVKSFDAVCSIIAGGDKPLDIVEQKNDTYRYPVIANGDGDRGILGYSPNYRICEKSVTIGSRGASIGNCRIVESYFTPAVRLIVLTPKQNINCQYLYYCSKQTKFKINGAGQAQLTVPNVKAASLPLPPLPLQQTFAHRIEQIEEQKKQITSALAKLETLLASRMQYWFE